VAGSDSDLRVGFVGLGDQGSPMARHVLERGWPLSFFARRPEVVERFEALGGTFVPSLPELGASADLVSVVVVDDAQVRDVVLGDGLLAAMAPGSILAIHSTVHPDTCRDLARTADARGVAVLDAPVSGGRRRGETADLTVMVGGDATAFERARPVFEAYGSMVRRLGPVGAGQLAKLINNYCYTAHLGTTADELQLIEALGLDLDATCEVLATGSGTSSVFQTRVARRTTSGHEKGAHYAMQVLAKDVRLLREVAAAAGAPLPKSDELVTRALEQALEESKPDEAS
jgi:3-hydroxyisobutyrate dehydrogenase-like beta-hydroxyacid dehydrogenase